MDSYYLFGAKTCLTILYTSMNMCHIQYITFIRMCTFAYLQDFILFFVCFLNTYIIRVCVKFSVCWILFFVKLK